MCLLHKALDRSKLPQLLFDYDLEALELDLESWVDEDYETQTWEEWLKSLNVDSDLVFASTRMTTFLYVFKK